MGDRGGSAVPAFGREALSHAAKALRSAEEALLHSRLRAPDLVGDRISPALMAACHTRCLRLLAVYEYLENRFLNLWEGRDI